MPKPYDLTKHDGKTVDWLTHAALLEAEVRLGYELTIVQGSYHRGVSASAGTHDGGGCVDLAPWDWPTKVKVLRSLGWAVWHRPAIRGLWREHIHGVLIGNDKLAPVAARQVASYRNGRDGLKGDRVDHTPRPATIPTYRWPGSDAALALEKKIRDRVADRDQPAIPTQGNGRLACDYSFARPRPSSIKAAGHHGVMRYISLGSKKDLSKAEAKQLHAAGLWIGLVWETTANRAGQGRAVGVSDAKAAEKAADALGYPKDAVIFYAVDYDAEPAAVRPYFAGVHSVARRPVGVYGGYRIVTADLAPWKWQATAWSAGRRDPSAHLFQRVGFTKKIAGSAAGDWDENVIVNRFPTWAPPKPAVDPPPAVKPPPATGPRPQPAPKPNPGTRPGRQLRIGTWNVLRGRLDGELRQNLTRLLALTKLDVLMLQETHGYLKVLTSIPGYTAVISTDIVEQSESTILVRDGLKLTGRRAVQVTFDPDGPGPGIAGWWTSSRGPNGPKTPAKHLMVATVEGFTFVSGHPAPSVQTAAQRLLHPNKWRSYREWSANTAATLATLGPRVCIGADWNVDARTDKGTQPAFPRAMLASVAMHRAFPHVGTHGRRVIDGFGVRGGVLMDVVTHPATDSDHRPVTAVLAY